jgi:sulfoxide reductase heme-binding subunit YedZ
MRWLKPLVHFLCLLPLAYGIWRTFFDASVINQVEYAIRYLGDWAIRFLLIALAVTPLRQLTGWARLASLRRMLGLYAFFYVVLHMLVFWGADLLFSPAALWVEIVKRPYITAGMAALALLIPLAITSTNGMVKRLGGARWRALHRLVYLAAPLAILHFYWMKSSKADVSEPLIYGAILVVLLGWRLLHHWGVAPRLPRPKG